MVKFEIKGLSKFTSRLNTIQGFATGKGKNTLFKAVFEGGEIIRTSAVKAISRGSRSGKVYKRGSKTHVASAIGEMPKTDTGELVSNITVKKIGKFAVDVGSREQAPQGYDLETREPRFGGRPWLQPTFDKEKDRVVKKIEKAVKKVVEKKI